MKTFKTAMIPTLLLLAGSALAQGQSNPSDVQRRSAEMMIPPGLATTVLGETPTPSTAVPSQISEADRRAQEVTRNTDMMRPQGINARSASGTAAATPVDENDRRMAEIIRRTDQMKPN